MEEYYTNPNAFHLKGKNRIGVILVHGMNCTPAEMRGIGEYLNVYGYSVYAVRLSGHGTVHTDLIHYNADDWIKDIKAAEKILRAECDKIFVLGKSMGSLLTANFAIDHKTSGIILISPPIFNSFYLHLIKSIKLIKYYFRMDKSKEFFIKSTNKPPFTVIYYTTLSFHVLLEVMKLSQYVQKNAFKIKTPALILQGAHDKLILKSSGRKLLSLLGSEDRKFILYKNSSHDLQVESERDEVWKTIKSFIEDKK